MFVINLFYSTILFTKVLLIIIIIITFIVNYWLNTGIIAKALIIKYILSFIENIYLSELL